MTVVVPPAQAAHSLSRWTKHAIALGVAALAMLLLFRDDVRDLVHIWWTSTTFGHCLFIGPVIAWLVWQRRSDLSALPRQGWTPGLAIVALGGTGWLMGDAGAVAFARQLGLLIMLQGAVVTILGPHVARGLLFPLCYAFFLVPFGGGLEAPLQQVTVRLVMPLLQLAGIPAASNGVLIHAGRYYFEVAEACSGAKFVIAMVAFGVLVANVCFLSWRRRVIFMVAAVIVPVLANGVRAFGTIWAADAFGLEAATGFDHIVYGWVFFGLVMAAVLAIGWRWFDRAPDAPAFDPTRLRAPTRQALMPIAAASLTIAVAALFPAWSATSASRAQRLPPRIEMPVVPGWRRVALSVRAPWMPYHPSADHYLFGRYADGSDAVDLSIAVYGSQREGKELVSFGTGVLREEDRWVRVADLPDVGSGSAMLITAPGPVERVVVTWYRVGDVVTADERLVKIETMKARLLGGPQRAVAIHVSTEVSPGHDPGAAIERFLARLGPLDRLADRAAGMN